MTLSFSHTAAAQIDLNFFFQHIKLIEQIIYNEWKKNGNFSTIKNNKSHQTIYDSGNNIKMNKWK